MKRLNAIEITSIKNFRKKGESISEISKTLSIPKTTVQRYTSQITLSKNAYNILRAKRGGSRTRSIKSMNEAIEYGKKIVNKMTVKEKILFASALYWAEGNKKDLMITNTDPFIIRTFTVVMTDLFDVRKEDIQVGIRLYEDLDRVASINFWANVLDINPKEIRAISVLQGKKSGKLPYGMCRIRIRKGGMILKKIKGINLAVAGSFS